MTELPIVRLKEICKTYQQGKVKVNAVNQLSLDINKGEFTAIYGPSGSGKTTVLNMIGALDVPTSGHVYLEGKDLKEMTRTSLSTIRRDRIGFVFQAYNLVPVLTAYENAEFVLALQGIEKRERKQRVMAILEEVGLADMADRRPDELSGGQQQRVAIARAIVPEPAIILADEPTANVDSSTANDLLDLMENLNNKKNITFLFSTHDQRVIDRAKRLVELKDGKVISNGK